MISEELAERLRAHFAAGPEPGLAPASPPDRRAPAVSCSLHVTELIIPPLGDAHIVATDGSADARGFNGGALLGGCAAVSAQGRVLAAWFEIPGPVRLGSVYAEWQGARLGLRLTAGWPSARLMTDNGLVAGQLQRVVAGRKADSQTMGANDELAMEEICRLARSTPLSVTWRGESPDEGITGGTALARSAHAAAWLVRRLASEGVDLSAHTDWVCEVISRAPRRQDKLLQAYLRRFNRDQSYEQHRQPRQRPGRSRPKAAFRADRAHGGMVD